jgi:hypothetical protein
LATVSPVTVSADAARALAIGGDVGEPLFQSALWCLASWPCSSRSAFVAIGG